MIASCFLFFNNLEEVVKIQFRLIRMRDACWNGLMGNDCHQSSSKRSDLSNEDCFGYGKRATQFFMTALARELNVIGTSE